MFHATSKRVFFYKRELSLLFLCISVTIIGLNHLLKFPIARKEESNFKSEHIERQESSDGSHSRGENMLLRDALNNHTLQKDYDQICKLDHAYFNTLMSANASQLNKEQIKVLLEKKMLSSCKEIKPFGGAFVPYCREIDGHKSMCVEKLLEDIEKNRCLIYSFGVGGDWSFESTLSDLGCEIHAYDPTRDEPENINFNFYKIGVSHQDKDEYMTVGNIIKANGHQDSHITMMKMDTEGAELKGIKVWLDEGALDNVHQFALEYHLGVEGSEREFLSTVQSLNKHQFRTIAWEVNSCYQEITQKQDKVLAEIVWARIPEGYNVSVECG